MNKVLCFLLLLLTVIGCHKQPIMTRQDFAAIEPGMSIKDIEKKYGPAYAIHSRDGSSDVYEYIERVLMGPETIMQWRYYFVVSNGKVVGKYSKYSTPPAFEQIYTDDPYPNY